MGWKVFLPTSLVTVVAYAALALHMVGGIWLMSRLLQGLRAALLLELWRGMGLTLRYMFTEPRTTLNYPAPTKKA